MFELSKILDKLVLLQMVSKGFIVKDVTVAVELCGISKYSSRCTFVFALIICILPEFVFLA